MQLGFVIDHSRCIGCHACTVACKSENHVPLGDFRTWVKYTESGSFPDVRRSFAVLRCNQCSDAPCVTICPVTALDKRPDGIVDLDQDVCIGCKACMHACPYDALYIDEATGTAEKCHFCAHRTELGLAPACAVVCPTEAIVPGDFDDPESRVSQLSREHQLTVRKPEAGTRPNVRYLEAGPAGLDPALANKAGGFLWSNPQTGAQMDAETFEALERRASGEAQARTVYDVPRKQLWGSKITDYLFTKSVAAGTLPVALGIEVATGEAGPLGLWPALVSLAVLSLCLLLLVLDLKRPERFYRILTRPNWNSWLARGSFLILGYQLLLGLYLLLGWSMGEPPSAAAFLVPAAILGGLTAAYTGWLFAQAKGRVLWMQRYLWLHLIAQAVLAGCATLALMRPLFELDFGFDIALTSTFFGALVLHAIFVHIEKRLAPRGREAEYARASRLLTHGPWSRRFWWGGYLLGVAAPTILLTLGGPGIIPLGVALPLAGLAALAGLRTLEDAFVRAAQALPIS